ncbi:MAG TPA: ABC transporter permease, partial [Verrucomicrobiae bacterium]|nr:ABC transporter permease [Verrucomicrobiae bacterium]
MRRLFAIAGLTWKSAFRFRLFLVLAALLILSVICLPVLIKDDGTARGFTQILLTYTLSTITGLLGLSTLWLSCGTLARDIEDCQMQVVAVKPISRWQIWLGKWLGIMALNATLLAVSGGSVYALLLWRSHKLPAPEQAILKNEVLVARGSAHEKSYDAEIEQETDRQLQERLSKNPVSVADIAEVRKQIHEQIKAGYQVIPPGYTRTWEINLGAAKDSLRNRPLQLRIKFNSADRSESGTFYGVWRVGVPKKT